MPLQIRIGPGNRHLYGTSERRSQNYELRTRTIGSGKENRETAADSGILLDRTKEFGLDVIRLVESFPSKMTSQVIGRQLLKSATSIGANYRSARRARSHADFISKMSIAQEEADETIYWFEMALGSGLVDSDTVGSLFQEADELTAILTSSIKTAKKRLNS